MAKSNLEQLKDLEIALLQLQRSALIDTQTIMQLLVDKGICSIDDIVSTRSKIETENKDILRIDEQIKELGGTVIATPVPEGKIKKDALKKQLGELLSLLKENGGLDNL